MRQGRWKKYTTAGTVALAGWAILGQAAETAAPAFQNLRYEDAPATREQSLFYTKLGTADGAELSVGGQTRVRGETWRNFNSVPANDDEFLLFRQRLHLDARPFSSLRFFVEGRSALAHDRDLPTPDKSGKRPIDEDTLDLANAFVELSQPVGGPVTASLRFGRQELSFGSERVIGALDWVNTRRTFDAARLTLRASEWQVDALAARLVTVQRYEFNDGDSGQDLFGAQAARKFAPIGMALEVYAWQRNKDGAAGAGDDERSTVGARAAGQVGASGVDYEVEAGWQFGDNATNDIAAWSVSSVVGYKIPDCPFKSRLFAGYDYASGDDDAADGKARRYDQLYPTGHKFFGLIDAIGRQNIQDFSAGLSAQPAAGITTRVEAHRFLRAATHDGVYDAGGNRIVAGDASEARTIGTEVDLTVNYQCSPRLALGAGMARLFAGDVLSEDIDTAYLSGQYTF